MADTRPRQAGLPLAQLDQQVGIQAGIALAQSQAQSFGAIIDSINRATSELSRSTAQERGIQAAKEEAALQRKHETEQVSLAIAEKRKSQLIDMVSALTTGIGHPDPNVDAQLAGAAQQTLLQIYDANPTEAVDIMKTLFSKAIESGQGGKPITLAQAMAGAQSARKMKEEMFQGLALGGETMKNFNPLFLGIANGDMSALTSVMGAAQNFDRSAQLVMESSPALAQLLLGIGDSIEANARNFISSYSNANGLDASQRNAISQLLGQQFLDELDLGAIGKLQPGVLEQAIREGGGEPPAKPVPRGTGGVGGEGIAKEIDEIRTKVGREGLRKATTPTPEEAAEMVGRTGSTPSEDLLKRLTPEQRKALEEFLR